MVNSIESIILNGVHLGGRLLWKINLAFSSSQIKLHLSDISAKKTPLFHLPISSPPYFPYRIVRYRTDNIVNRIVMKNLISNILQLDIMITFRISAAELKNQRRLQTLCLCTCKKISAGDNSIKSQIKKLRFVELCNWISATKFARLIAGHVTPERECLSSSFFLADFRHQIDLRH